MRLSLLEERESVLAIMVASLNDHFEGEVKVSEKRPVVKNSALTFFGNKYLNFFATTSTPPQNFEVIRKEYTNSKQVWKRLIQKFYVRLATTPFIYNKLHHYKLYFSGKNETEYKDMLIMGGNTRLRIIRARAGETEVILKKNYPNTFVKNEIEFRTKYSGFEYIPQLKSHRSHSFVEALHPGVPINRLSQDSLKQYRLEAYHAFYQAIVIPNLIFPQDYISQLLECVHRKTKEANILAETKVFSSLEVLFKEVSIPISYSHGDFQDANLILSENGLKIIDWESVNKRSVFYDYLTLFSNSRHGINLDRIKKISNEMEDKHGLTRNQIICLYLLEEIDYYFTYLPLYQKSNENIRSKISYLFQSLKDIIKEFE